MDRTGRCRSRENNITKHNHSRAEKNMSLVRPTRRKLLSTMSAAAAVTGIGISFPRPAIAQLAKVRYTLSWLPTGQYAFIYSARQLGYFKKRGIDLDISRGYGSMAAIQAVATGQFDMGGAQTGANLLSIMKGLDLRLLGTQGYDATLGIVVPEKGPVKTPKDLEGRKIGVSAAGGDTPFLPAYCRMAGVDFSRSASSNSTARSSNRARCPASLTPSS